MQPPVLYPWGDPILSLHLPIEPVAATRPRVTRQGWAYHTKTYKRWIGACEAFFAEVGPVVTEPFSGPLALWADFVGTPPRTTKLSAPRGDIDNYCKALLDSLTRAAIWVDDAQIHVMYARKRWAAPGDKPGVLVHLYRHQL